jgi:hypothetical protein
VSRWSCVDVGFKRKGFVHLTSGTHASGAMTSVLFRADDGVIAQVQRARTLRFWPSIVLTVWSYVVDHAGPSRRDRIARRRKGVRDRRRSPGKNRAILQRLIRHISGTSMGDFMRALELSEDVTAQIRSGALGTEIPSGSLRATSKAWQRITMNKQIHDLRETAAALMARAEKSTNIEEIAQLKLQAREAEAQAVQLRADEPGLEDLVPA